MGLYENQASWLVRSLVLACGLCLKEQRWMAVVGYLCCRDVKPFVARRVFLPNRAQLYRDH